MGPRWAGIILFLFSVAAGGGALRLRLGTLQRPGPGFFPFWISVGLLAASLALLLPAPRGPGAAADRVPLAGLPRVLSVSAGLAAYGALLGALGFAITTFAFLLFLWVAIDRRGLASGALLAGGVTTAAYLLFDSLLRVQFPRGPLGF